MHPGSHIHEMLDGALATPASRRRRFDHQPLHKVTRTNITQRWHANVQVCSVYERVFGM
jgi:hypothetical protein